MDQLIRFARRLAERLGTTPGEVYRPVSVTELRATILPYRTHRRALELETVEDYETVLLRLAAEESGFVKTLPAAAAERCRKELAEPNPDLAVLDEIGEATVQITSLAAARIGADAPPATEPPPVPAPPKESARAPRVVAPPPLPQEELPLPQKNARAAPAGPVSSPRRSEPEMSPTPAPAKPPAASAAAPAASCRHCQHALPEGRQVVFCPWCGERLIPFTCGRCGTELASDWKHCITCGAPVKDPYRFA
jgi:hypothetical protein